MKHSKITKVEYFFLLILALIGVKFIAREIGRQAAEQVNHTEKKNSNEVAPVIAVVTIQDSEGITEKDLDQLVLKNLESWLVQTMVAKARRDYAESGYDPNDLNPKVMASSVYTIVDGKKLAIIKTSMDNSVRSVTVIGFKGKECYRVTCIRASNHDIPVFYGECGKKIKEVFGVSAQN